MSDRPPSPRAARAAKAKLHLLRVTGVLGRGGIAETLRAELRVGGAQVTAVVKRLLPTLVDDDAAVARLAEEARVLSRLGHPRIPRFLGIGDDDGLPFFAAELRHAGPLPSGVRVSEAETLTLALDVTSALAHAHGLGVIHRDVSRGNVLVDDDGRGVLIDFGIARALDRPRHTRSDVVIGTPGSMAPEQAQGKRATAAADVWSLGVLLFSLLSGQHPLGVLESDPVELRLERARTMIPAALADDVDAAFAAVVHACLQREPTNRPRDAIVLAELLAPLVRGVDLPAARLALAARRVGVTDVETETTLE
ncbi:MAG: serine/threonine-protein kinase [Deltaproteobacteria bacterium]|nr:serine/threonine-protein kinase [Deltaproteobacteria bacterium]